MPSRHGHSDQWRSLWLDLPKRQPEECLLRQAGLDRCIGNDRLATALAGRQATASRDQTRSTATPAWPESLASNQRRLDGSIVVSVRGAVGGGIGFAHASQLPRWIPEVNPPLHLRKKPASAINRVWYVKALDNDGRRSITA